MNLKEYSVQADADWRVYSVEYRYHISESGASIFLFRNDITEAEDDVAWAKNYARAYRQLRGKPVELQLTATDELDAFVKAQAWFDKRRGR